MSVWMVFIQVVVNIGLLLGLFLLWARSTRPQKEDPRMSKGLQLLQSKISILEDLSDRSDLQVRQLSALLSSKVVEVQQKINESDRQILAIDKSIEKSLEVSKIFQDKIPHREIIERENSFKYIEAARMAHRGVTAEEISQQLSIPHGEAQIIVNMNKDRLNIRESDVPLWAKPSAPPEPVAPQEFPISPLKSFADLEAPVHLPPTPTQTMPQTMIPTENPSAPGPVHVLTTAKNKPLQVTPYQFPQINAPDKKYI